MYMIQSTTETNLTTFLCTEDNRIDTSVSSDKIRHLVKFINDMDKSIQYAYSTVVTDKTGTGQVQYTQHTEPSGDNYIWYGQ